MGFNPKNLAVDKDKATGGVLIDFMEGSKLKIAKAGRAYQKALLEMYDANAEVLKSKSEEAQELDRKLTRQLAAKLLLVDWEGIVGDDGKEVAYSVEKAEEYLQYEEVFEFVMANANKRELYRIERNKEKGEAVKNS